MWCLWDLGQLAERIFQRWSYVGIYLLSGVAGSIASVWRHPLGVSAGASGAIFGIAGALISALYLGKLPVPKVALTSTLKSLLFFAGFNLLIGQSIRGIDNSAHLGGIITGLALGAVFGSRLDGPARKAPAGTTGYVRRSRSHSHGSLHACRASKRIRRGSHSGIGSSRHWQPQSCY
jgi:rhomboid protease GluP